MPKPTLLLVISDTHCNSGLGLCPPQGVRLLGGQRVLPSPVQHWQWSCWLDLLKRTRTTHKRLGGQLVVVMNGDMVEGLDHHDTTEVMARTAEAQEYITEEVFGPLLDLRPDRLLVVRGTPAHVGPEGSSEEIAARWLKAEKDPETECWSRYHLRLRLHGLLIDCQHHGKGLGHQPWTAQNGATSLANRVWMTHALRKLEPPRLVFRSHLHRFADSYDANPHTRAIFTPAFQLKTSFGHKVAADSIADIGGILVPIYPNGRFEVEPVLYQPDLPREV